MSKCDKCVNPQKELCEYCVFNPNSLKIQVKSYFQPYIPTCPRGYKDCVCDPAYIKYVDSEWYKELYGEKTPYEVAEECRQLDEEFYCYDDEDK